MSDDADGVSTATEGRVAGVPVASDSVTLRAEMNLVLSLSSCAQDVTSINKAARTTMEVAVHLLPPSLPEAM